MIVLRCCMVNAHQWKQQTPGSKADWCASTYAVHSRNMPVTRRTAHDMTRAMPSIGSLNVVIKGM